MKARTVAFVLTAVLVFYFLLLGDRAAILMGDDRITFKLLGLGVLLLPVIGAWTVWRELALGMAAQRLGAELGDFDTDFASAKSRVEHSPEDWRAWYILAISYGQARDTRNGRAAMRQAVELKARESRRS